MMCFDVLMLRTRPKYMYQCSDVMKQTLIYMYQCDEVIKQTLIYVPV